jgi:hypothetical protein
MIRAGFLIEIDQLPGVDCDQGTKNCLSGRYCSGAPDLVLDDAHVQLLNATPSQMQDFLDCFTSLVIEYDPGDLNVAW